MFTLYDIPAELRTKLLLPRLTEKARTVVSKLTVEQLNDYSVLRKTLLTEFKLTPRELRARFNNATRKQDESYALFAARLESLLLHYLRSREADNDPKLMFSLLVADRLKETLPAGALQYVLSLEGDECFSPGKIAATADIYASNYDDTGKYRGATVSNIQLDDVRAKQRFVPNAQVSKQPQTAEVQKGQSAKPSSGNGTKCCFNCGSNQHLIKQCDKKEKKAKEQKYADKIAKSQACMVAERNDVVIASRHGLQPDNKSAVNRCGLYVGFR